MSMVKNEPGPQKSSVSWLRVGTILAGVGGLWLLSQVIWAAASAAAGLAVIGVIGVVGIAVFQSLPMLAQKWENKLLGLRKAEARANPIEQAENDLLRREAQLQSFKSAMENVNAQIIGLENSLKRTRRDKPNYDLSEQTAAVEKMQLFYNNRMKRFGLAVKAREDFKNKIEEAKMKWEFQQQANMAIRAMNASDKDAKINEILTEVAFDSVQKEFDTIFAKLDVDAAEMSAEKQIEFAPNATLDLSAIDITPVVQERKVR